MTQKNKLIAALIAVIISTASQSEAMDMDYDAAIDFGFQIKDNKGEAQDALFNEVKKDIQKQWKDLAQNIIEDNIPGVSTLLTAKKITNIALSENPVKKLTNMGLKKVGETIVNAIPYGKYLWGGFKYIPFVSNYIAETAFIQFENTFEQSNDGTKTSDQG